MIKLLNVYYPTRTIILILCESLIVGGSFVLASAIVLGPNTLTVLGHDHGIMKIAALTVCTILFAYYFDLYEPQHISARWEIYFRLLLVMGCLAFALSAVVYVFPQAAIARFVFLLGLILVVAGLIAWRSAFEWISGHAVFQERVYVLGEGERANSIIETIREHREAGMVVVGWDAPAVGKDERRKTFATAVERMASEASIDRIVVALDDRRGELPVDGLLSMRFRGVTIEEVGSVLERLTGKLQLDGLRPSDLLFCEGFRMKPSQQFLLRVASTLVAAIGLILFLPFSPFVVLLVRLSSPGPVFFRQERVGLNGKIFNVYKFRTMVVDAEADGAQWAQKNDPRVTRVGQFMRKTRLDEVPQLWNVLRGDMSFVGPRPERPEFVSWLAQELPFYEVRNMIRPGLTGWAQIRYGYGATLEESREKLAFDLYYVKHQTLGLDLLIMFETIKTILRRRGAQ
ncbi:MAG: TIGR03013 family PEP-CTERM/XrtA system glycosyltransferase [Acidobacteriota bacterium]|nr:TIGR03013 family PEP-CTERM/XrtA system glycosyltransferase [Acidobacteriota bacterium]